ncbi:sensor domain-containing diguanylate cyclase [Pseudoalteromonas tunicata]|uniref:sensor domain-containing diguanylate cyclase n=1 Tax=Pseudoalteromonas tunicata TaxID=314281 RepID=UPI00273EF465|nr:sensor domain-containing diguanylate cyclase [Pseudoalteromonas tunicata]MDP5213640.1 sensor domain-containing diguanylate cyclase [Pseudoalteromonas tunicata]
MDIKNRFTLKLKLLGAVILGLICIAAVALFGLKLWQQAKYSEDILVQFSTPEIKRSHFLQDLIYGFGYGGFIHNFKNYVLRKDVNYYYKAIDKAQITLDAIDAYLKLDLNDDQITNINLLRDTVVLYQEKLSIAHQLISNNLDIEQIDLKVRVDDTHAIQALGNIIAQTRSSVASTKQKAEENLQEFENLLVYFFTIIIGLLVLCFGYLVFTLSLLISKYNEIEALFNASPYAIINANEKGLIIRANKKACELFDYQLSSLKKLCIDELVPDRYRATHHKKRTEFIQSDQHLAMQNRKSQLFAKNKHGQNIPVSISVASYWQNNEKRSIAIIKDDSKEIKLRSESRTDTLTQVGNRIACNEKLESNIAHSERYSTELSIILIDIDHFKNVNDKYGHLTGDQVLIQVAQLLKAHIRESDSLFRWGGEEFLIITPNTGQQQAAELAEKLRRLTQVHSFHDEFNITISLGITSYLHARDTSKSLFHRIDKALYQAKNSGRNTCCTL